MGGCASKSSVLKGDEPIPAPPPVPGPPPQKEEDTVVKEAVVEDPKKEEAVEATNDHDDDAPNKNRSLGNLFMESVEGKDSTEKEIVKAFDVPESTPPKEVEKAVTETSEEKKTEDAKPQVIVAENVEKPLEKTEVINVITPEKTKLDEIKPIIAKPEEKQAQVNTGFVEAEEKFEAPKETDVAQVKIAEGKILTPEEKRPAAPAQVKVAEDKILTPEEKKPAAAPAQVKVVAEDKILDPEEKKTAAPPEAQLLNQTEQKK